MTAVTAPEGTPAKVIERLRSSFRPVSVAGSSGGTGSLHLRRPTGTDGDRVANEEARHQLEAESDR